MSTRDCANDKIIRFNVGGKKFMTTYSTVSKYPSSVLKKKADLHLEQSKIEEAIFLDRDSKSFGVILNYMRNGRLTINACSCSPDNLLNLKEEAAFYGLEELVTEISMKEKESQPIQKYDYRLISVSETELAMTLSNPTNNWEIKHIIPGLKRVVSEDVDGDYESECPHYIVVFSKIISAGDNSITENIINSRSFKERIKVQHMQTPITIIYG